MAVEAKLDPGSLVFQPGDPLVDHFSLRLCYQQRFSCRTISHLHTHSHGPLHSFTYAYSLLTHSQEHHHTLTPVWPAAEGPTHLLRFLLLDQSDPYRIWNLRSTPNQGFGPGLGLHGSSLGRLWLGFSSARLSGRQWETKLSRESGQKRIQWQDSKIKWSEGSWCPGTNDNKSEF